MIKTGFKRNLRALVESALLIAVGFVLSYIKLFDLPQGGSVTALSMLPLLLIGLRHGPKWGLSSGLVFACLQMLQSFWPPPSGTASAYIAVIILDYILAFTVLGVSGFFRGRRYGLLYAAPLCIFLRFICHFFSGMLIWSYYAGDKPAWIYSLVYNGSYIGVELVLTIAASAALCKTAPMLFGAAETYKK